MNKEDYIRKFTDWALVLSNSSDSNNFSGFLETFLSFRDWLKGLPLPACGCADDFCKVIWDNSCPCQLTGWLSNE